MLRNPMRLVLLSAALIAAAAALAGAAPQPGPPPVMNEPPSRTPDGLLRRYSAYYRVFEGKDFSALRTFYGPGMRETFRPAVYTGIFADMRAVAEKHEVWFEPVPRGERPRVATVLTTLKLTGAATLWLCHVTEWWWGQAFGDPANWFLVHEVVSREFAPCGEAFKPRT